MPPCHGGDHGFESRMVRQKRGPIAQLVEQGTENPCVGGSTPPWATISVKKSGQIVQIFLFLHEKTTSASSIKIRSKKLMKQKIALITGASSGIGKEFALQLDQEGYRLILCSRRKELLEEVASKCHDAVIFPMDVTNKEDIDALLKEYPEVDLFINNAGFGVHGSFLDTSLEKEIAMLETNIIAMHTLMKEYLKIMVKRDQGTILNVSSIASFFPGPYMASYYASKAYVTRLTEAVREELKKSHSNVQISLLCPGPVNTNFSKEAGVSFALKGDSPQYVAKYALKMLKKGKFYIIPNAKIRLAKIGAKFAPTRLVSKIAMQIQKKKFNSM